MPLSILHTQNDGIYSRSICLLSLMLALVSLSLTEAKADLPTTFDFRVQLDLCPEYKLGGVSLETFYTVGVDPTQFPITPLQTNIAADQKTAEIDFRLPSTLGSLPINVFTACRNSFGLGLASNPATISNCDSLARFDTDADGIANNLEDTNCDNFYSPGDISNPDNVDTDGDGVRDLVEILEGKDPSNPGVSPRPYIFASSRFDPDADGESNALVWRGSTGNWFTRNYNNSAGARVVQFGLPGDVPFTYKTLGQNSEVGVIRRQGLSYLWLFNGLGFEQGASRSTAIPFGIFGDNIIPGAWESPGITNPAVARLFNGTWFFYILNRNGTIHSQAWGGNGDIPKPQDFDGDGLLDVAVFRPATQETYAILSGSGTALVLKFGSGTAEHTVRGDFTGDGIEEITTWEPSSGIYGSLLSDQGFDTNAAGNGDPNHIFEMQLGLFFVHLPLNWNYRNGGLRYTVIDHASGLRYWRENNQVNGTINVLQWGLPGDHQG